MEMSQLEPDSYAGDAVLDAQVSNEIPLVRVLSASKAPPHGKRPRINCASAAYAGSTKN